MESQEIKTLLSTEDIQSGIAQLGERLNKIYKNEELYVVCVLKGAVIFAVDLVKHLEMPVKMEFIRLSSYGSSTTTSGKVNAVDILMQIITFLMLMTSFLSDTVLIMTDTTETCHTLDTFKTKYLLIYQSPVFWRIIFDTQGM